MSETRAMETELKTRKEIGRQLDDLIRAASRNVAKLFGSEMEKNQIRNVLNLAATSESVEEVTNFIRYQIGREGRQRSWSHNGFGKAVIEDIETGQVKTAVDAVMDKVPEADRVSVRSQLILLYLGYLNRHFMYASRENDWKPVGSEVTG